ncbi:Regulator of microtubule dynamics protein 1 [Trichinella nativa]|uniref:Regulator of microtubule dynamics protein 1 n=5 Tax=Trichinella TaxID=6333 RepID=A0A0V1LJN0_9BILA|nr:Regulator of microtubule dynamics protein 1 [Trichinella patagoniensis]KRZ59699.1 Regulator of microtubule dynamics protein 1 [Trichinella nativa]
MISKLWLSLFKACTSWKNVFANRVRTLVYHIDVLLRSEQFSRFYTSQFAFKVKLPVALLAMSFFKPASETDEEEEWLNASIKRADRMYDSYMIDELYEYLRKATERKRHAELMWRLARVTCEKGKLCRNYEERVIFFAEAMEYINEALKTDSEISAVHKWYAILLDYNGSGASTEVRVENAKEMKNHLDRALELNPLDATSWYILGLWFYSFSDLPWYQRKLCSLLYRELPSATFQAALDCFQRAELISPNFYSQNLLMLGKTYLKMNHVELAKHYLNRTVQFTVVTVDDQRAHDEAELLLKQMKC